MLDAGAAEPDVTLLCVHGNPTWSYLWRGLLARAGQGDARFRVIAVDQLEMGFSERTGRSRRLADRIDDLGRLTDALALSGPVVTVAHDWGGPISLGWAQRHRALLAGVVLCNTAVHQPAGAPAPAVIRTARLPGVLPLVTERTRAFIAGTTALSGRRMDTETAAAFASPYASARRRAGIRAFVADIPLRTSHPSAECLDDVAAGLSDLADVPALLLWGPGDPVFSDLYLRDLRARLPQADVHRYEGARHLVTEDAPHALDDLLAWIRSRVPLAGDHRPARAQGPGADDIDPGQRALPTGRRLWHELERRATESPEGAAIVSMRADGRASQVTWAELLALVDGLACGLAAEGIRPGDRVSVLIPPSPALVAAIYACWRIGAAAIVTDAGLGVRGMRRAIRGAHPDHVIAVPAGLALARTLRIPGRRIRAVDLPRIARASSGPPPDQPPADAEAVIAFTSGATGPAKGVVYRHWQVERTRDVIARHYQVTEADALIAAFAPWAVLGPALGIASAIPAMDVTRPRTLRASALARAAAAVGGTLLWSSPAALANVIRTQGELDDAGRAALARVRIAMFAGAPVPSGALARAASIFPAASIRTPYGMTEALPLTDVTSDEIAGAGRGNGVLVGAPIAGVEVGICPLDALGDPTGERTARPTASGEILVRCDHLRDGYDALWATTHRASADGWHRTGDVGHIDAKGRLWVEGRLAHVITTEDGPCTPVGIEQRAMELDWVDAAAAVGVGPRGCQQVVVVVTGVSGRGPLVDVPRTLSLRAHLEAAGFPAPAAVLRRDDLPVDIRHNAKVDRTALARWADRILAGVAR